MLKRSLTNDRCYLFRQGLTWIPFQYYSTNCEEVFQKNSSEIITRANEQEALCIDTKSQLTSTTTTSETSRIAFSTLEGRPSAYEFDSSPVLQDWVTATDIKIVLHSTNKSLTYYSLADVAVGGRCKCNGHASRCITNRYVNRRMKERRIERFNEKNLEHCLISRINE